MDKQAALMKRYQKDEHTIAYVHNGDIVLLKKDFTNDSIQIVEIVMDSETEVVRSRRTLRESEMSISQFDTFKQTLTEETRIGFNADWRQTHLNVEFDAMSNTELTCNQSTPEETENCQSSRTIEKAYRILHDAGLTKVQIRRYVQHYYHGLSTWSIAAKEGKAQRSIMDSIELAEKKNKKIFSKS